MICDVLQLQWGWITPGTGEANRHEQSDAHFRFLSEPVTPYRRHFLLTHCGWWLDRDASDEVRRLTGSNPEPHRALAPCGPDVVRRLRRYIRAGRLDFAVYPYAACVAEATSGEGLLRSLRYARDIARDMLGRPFRAVLNHDFVYGLDWGAAQMPRIATLLGFDVILAMEDGWVRGPDGTRLRILGRPEMRARLCRGFADGAAIFHPLELTQNMDWHRRLPQVRAEFPQMAGVEFRAITLEEYLRRVPARRVFDSRVLGAKSWYGGTIDSLAQEQNVKAVELRLPAIEALGVQTGRDDAFCAARDDLWKKTFILMDNHTLWQCHDYKAHYLPESARLVRDTFALEQHLLARAGGASPARPGARAAVAFFNPVPWPRDVVVAEGRRTWTARNVPGWGVAVRPRAEALSRPTRDRNTRLLANDRVSFRLNGRGEVVAWRRGGVRRHFAGLGALMRICETPTRRARPLRAGEALPLEGALSVSCEVELGGEALDRVFFEMPGLTGGAFLLQSERLDPAGRTVAVEWAPLHSLHWGGKGLPRHHMDIGPRPLKASGAARVRLTLWMLAQGEVRLGVGRLWLGDEGYVDLSTWRAVTHYRNAYARPRNVRARVLRSDDALKTVRFMGDLPDLRYELDISLRRGSEALEYALRLEFPRPTPLGLSSPPLSREDGSMLGAQCERPYVPGLAVLFPLPQAAEYFADKPFFIQRVLQPSPRTWHTDARDWWLGMSPFIGMNLAAAEWRGGQLGLFTRGIKHFFRWRRGGGEALALSLGASLIHQKTQGHSVPKDSALYDILKRTDHDPYFATPFLYAHGRYEFHFALAPTGPGDAARLTLWKQAQEFALPASAAGVGAGAVSIPGVTAEPGSVVVTALERTRNGMRLRAVNLCDHGVGARIRVLGRTLRTKMPPWGIVELAVGGVEVPQPSGKASPAD